MLEVQAGNGWTQEEVGEKAVARRGRRNCCRCGEPLTDAASLDAGVGPWCRRYANEELAKSMPTALVRMDLLALLAIEVTIPEVCTKTWGLVSVAIDKVMAAGGGTGFDLRETCLRIVWILSLVPRSSGTRVMLLNLIGALGYGGLEALIADEVTIGAVTAEFYQRRLRVVGTRCKTAQAIAKKESRNYLQAGKGETPFWWSLPHTEAALFERLAGKYYYEISGLQEALVEARADLGPPCLQLPGKPIQILQGEPGWVRVISPFNAEYIAAIRALPYKLRRWDGVAWQVAFSKLSEVADILAKCYPDSPVTSPFPVEVPHAAA